MKYTYLFYCMLLLYWGTYLFPFAYGLTGIELEGAVWRAILNHKPTLSGYIVVWSLRSFINALVIVICWMRWPSVRRWITFHIDGDFLYQLLLGLVTTLLLYALFLMGVRWNWGVWVWAGSTFLVLLLHRQYGAKISSPAQANQDLERHLVPLEEEEY